MFYALSILFFPQVTFSTCPLTLVFPVPKAPFQCFLSLILCKGELRSSFGITEPRSHPTGLQLFLLPESFFFFFLNTGAFHLPVSHLFHHSLFYPFSLLPFALSNFKSYLKVILKFFLDQDHSMDEMTAVVKIEKGVGGNNGGNGNGSGAFSQARSSSTGSSSSSGGGGQVSDDPDTVGKVLRGCKYP